MSETTNRGTSALTVSAGANVLHERLAIGRVKTRDLLKRRLSGIVADARAGGIGKLPNCPRVDIVRQAVVTNLTRHDSSRDRNTTEVLSRVLEIMVCWRPHPRDVVVC